MKTSFRIVILLLSGAFLLSSVSCGKAASGAGKAACKGIGKLFSKAPKEAPPAKSTRFNPLQYADDVILQGVNGGDDNKRSKRGRGGFGGGYYYGGY